MTLGSHFFAQVNHKIAQNFAIGSLCSTLVSAKQNYHREELHVPLGEEHLPQIHRAPVRPQAYLFPDVSTVVCFRFGPLCALLLTVALAVVTTTAKAQLPHTAQANEEVPSITEEIPASFDAPKPGLIRRLYGTVPAPSVLYHPWRSHYWPYQDIGYTHLYGATFKSIAYFSFINSYSERCHLIAFRRNWYDGERLDIAVGGGVNYGYDGRLYFAQSIPRWIRETILFSTDFNPMVGLDFSYRISKGFHAQLVFSPIFVTWGATYQMEPQRKTPALKTPNPIPGL